MRNGKGSALKFILNHHLLGVTLLVSLVCVAWAEARDSATDSKHKRSTMTIAQYAARKSGTRASKQFVPEQLASRNRNTVQVGEVSGGDTTSSPPVVVDRSVPVNLTFTANGLPRLSELPVFKTTDGDRFFSLDQRGNRIYYTINPGLQSRAESILDLHRVSWGSLVALDPRTGKVLALASRANPSDQNRPTALRATFPAASLFKVITGAAAVETSGMNGGDLVYFRGGNHTLERYNYLPDFKRDRRVMSLEEAMGKSVNPVFARIALQKLSRNTIKTYAEKFGFNSTLSFDAPLEPSSFRIAFDDYNVARTAAGFGDAYLSPLHAASWMGALSQHGRQMRPVLIDEVRDPNNQPLYQSHSQFIGQIVNTETANELMAMMRATTENGTARKFFHGPGSLFNNLPVSGKTGTLSGVDPKGMYFWFVGAVPTHAPEIAVASLVIDTDHRARIRGSHAAKHLLDYYFRAKFGMAPPAMVVSEPRGGGSYRKKSKRQRVVVKSRSSYAKKKVSTKKASTTSRKKRKRKG